MIVRSIAGGVEVLAPAKLNLFLEVLKRRPDGYHEIESLMVAVDLHDVLTVRDEPSGRIVLECDDPSLPVDGRNLVVKAAELLRASTGCSSRRRGSASRRRFRLRRGWPADRATRRRRWRRWIGSGTLRPLPDGSTRWPGEIGSDVAFFLHAPGGGLPRSGRAGGTRFALGPAPLRAALSHPSA